jgi:hypothetical protein
MTLEVYVLKWNFWLLNMLPFSMIFEFALCDVLTGFWIEIILTFNPYKQRSK